MSTEVEVAALPDCDFCLIDSSTHEVSPAAYDGKTAQGPWANMCERHWQQHGIKLGTGFGQRLILRVSE